METANFKEQGFEISLSQRNEIKEFVLKNKPIIQQFVAQEMEIPQTFFEDNFICCGCGEIFEKATYAIAQNALGHSVVYKCDCGHKTVLK